jgi:hypothetical protein
MKWMACEVEFTDEFGEWWGGLAADEQEGVRAYVKLLDDYGVALKHPPCRTTANPGRLNDVP